MDYELSGKNCELSITYYELSGKDCDLSRTDYELSGKDCALSRTDYELSGKITRYHKWQIVYQQRFRDNKSEI